MANSWEVGALYPPGGLNNVKWSQPGGPGTLVYPQQQTGVDYFSIKPFSELSGQFACGCGHYVDQPLIQREFDFDTEESVALICCPMCGYVQYTLEPFESALNTVLQPQLPI
jgi:hypothetical protein